MVRRIAVSVQTSGLSPVYSATINLATT